VGRRVLLLSAVMLLPLGGCRFAAPPAVAPGPAPIMPFVADSVRESPPLHRAHWGIAVFDVGARAYLYDNQAHRNFIPASVQKLVLSAVALAELGVDFRFRTELLALDEAAPAGARVVVAGRGDPTLSRRYHTAEFAALDSLADSLRLAGITGVSELVVDAGYFTDALRHPAWELGDMDWAYGAAPAAFAVEEGTFGLVVRPGAAPGAAAAVQVVAPPEAVLVQAAITTDTGSAPFRLDIARRTGSDTLQVGGSIGALTAERRVDLAVGDPARYAAHALAWRLRLRGVEVAAVRVAPAGEDAQTAARAAGARSVATWVSPPLEAVVTGTLGATQNWMAEQLLKTLGATAGEGGSWAGGARVLRAYLRDVVGLDTLAFRLSDGSGLSVQNLVAPHAVVRLLEHATAQPWGPAFQRALPQPGQAGTTLANRLTGLEGRVRAKTGTLTNVTALAGYITTFDGRELIFAILVNGSGIGAAPVREGIDAVVQAAARERRVR
jgi:serine-type D-Ala-D-Ala carboxypeptidase/endopeptidase (penicillin-binding protein 4)